VAMHALCGWYGISRQAHYQMLERHHQQQMVDELVIVLVQEVRRRHPRMGARKLLHVLEPQLEQEGVAFGRDRFFELLAQYDLLVPCQRQRRRTTWPGVWRCPNRLAGLVVSQVQQVWVCDITYLETECGFCYLCLLTDAYSRYIVGYDVSTSLAVEGALRGLEKAVAQTCMPLAGLIHHSDHGIQYTCHPYRDRLSQLQIAASMGEIGSCYDNAKAERINGILKLEYGLGQLLLDFDHARQLTTEAVWLYNQERPHWALDYRTPASVHGGLEG